MPEKPGEKDQGKAKRDEPVSLAPLDPEDALRALLATPQDDHPSEDDDSSSGLQDA